MTIDYQLRDFSSLSLRNEQEEILILFSSFTIPRIKSIISPIITRSQSYLAVAATRIRFRHDTDVVLYGSMRRELLLLG